LEQVIDLSPVPTDLHFERSAMIKESLKQAPFFAISKKVGTRISVISFTFKERSGRKVFVDVALA